MQEIKTTTLELKVLRILWDLGNKGTIHQILEHWQHRPVPGYTTILKKLQVMEKKGLMKHEKQNRSYMYIPLVSEKDVSTNKLKDLIDLLFSGDKLALAGALFKDAAFNKEELSQVKEMIDEMEKEDKNG